MLKVTLILITGLWYAQRSKKRKEEENNPKNMPELSMNFGQAWKVNKILDSLDSSSFEKSFDHHRSGANSLHYYEKESKFLHFFFFYKLK